MKLLKFILALGVGVIFGLMVFRDPGYMLMAWDVWTIEMPIWVFFVWLALVLGAVMLLNHFVYELDSFFSRLQFAIVNAKSKRADRFLSEGLTLLARADYFAAEKRLVKAAKISAQPLLAFLGAAKAARYQNAEGRAVAYIEAAQTQTGSDELAVGLEKARIEIESENVAKALETLAECERLAPKHPELTALILQVALKTKDIERIRDTLENAASSQATPEDTHALEKAAIELLLTHFKDNHKFRDAESFYHRLPRRLQSETDALCGYADVLIASGENERARKFIEQALKKKWHSDLIKRYGFIHLPKPAIQLKQAEKWLIAHPKDPNLLLTLARLYQQQQFWGKARLLLQQSIQISPQPETYFELGQVCRACNEPAASVKYFEEGLKLSTEGIV